MSTITFGWASSCLRFLWLLHLLHSTPHAVADGVQLLVEPTDAWTSLNRSEFTNNRRLEIVSIENNHIVTLGTTLSKHLALYELQLNDNPRFDLDAQDVAYLASESLQTLQLSGCHLVAIGNNGSFGRLPQLRTLVLDRNKLTAIPTNMLAGTNVSTLSLSGNEAFNFPLEQPVLVSDRLRQFRCNKCGITRIHTDTFEMLPALERLELNGNRITLVYTLSFGNNPMLAVIQLNNNQLSAYPLEAVNTPPLQELCLDGNSFTVSAGTTQLKERYAKYALRGKCPMVDEGGQRLDDIEDSRLPGISDAFIASYLVLIVLVQAILGAMLVVYCVRKVYVRRSRMRRGSEEFDYAAGVVNESMMYQYVK